LIAKGGAYFKLHEAQARGETEAPEAADDGWSDEEDK